MTDTSFLPEDYLAQKSERRTNLICLTLFAMVMLGVFGAFWFTNRHSNAVKKEQAIVNAKYEQAGRQIEELAELEAQKEEMLDKAELAAALVERVPRSILLAELINRMPDRLSLLEFELESQKVKRRRVLTPEEKKALTKGPSRAPTKEEAGEKVNKIEAPQYQVTITMVGIAPTDLEVSRYMAELNAYPLMEAVQLEYSEETDFDGRLMREFKIQMAMTTAADVRNLDPLIVPRDIKNPMSDDFTVGSPQATAPKANPKSAAAGRVRIGD